jgi:hypothetical protein
MRNILAKAGGTVRIFVFSAASAKSGGSSRNGAASQAQAELTANVVAIV